eukprot:4204446-Amphidinium_carterae.1
MLKDKCKLRYALSSSSAEPGSTMLAATEPVLQLHIFTSMFAHLPSTLSSAATETAVAPSADTASPVAAVLWRADFASPTVSNTAYTQSFFARCMQAALPRSLS